MVAGDEPRAAETFNVTGTLTDLFAQGVVDAQVNVTAPL
jgi:hypothetical protein